MAYSKAKLKSIGVRASPCFKPFLIGNLSDTRYTKINYKIVPETNFNKYLQYGTSGSNNYIDMNVNNGSEK